VLYIDRILGSLPYGNSKPIKIVATDGKTYVLKFRKDYVNGKDRSNTNEYIASKLIEYFEFNIAPQKVEFIEIDDVAIELAKSANISTESLSYFIASKGINLGIEFLENCEKASKEEITNNKFMQEVKTIDMVMMNPDRNLDNTNILKDVTKKSGYYAIDWGLSMDATELYGDVKRGDIKNRYMYYQNKMVVDRPEYIFRDIKGFSSVKKKDIEGIIRTIVEGIPEEWETHFCMDIIIDILTSRVQNLIK